MRSRQNSYPGTSCIPAVMLKQARTWAAWYSVQLLIKWTLKGGVFSFLFFSFLTGSQDHGGTVCSCCRLEGHLNDSTARTADLTAKLTASEAELKQGAVSYETSLTNYIFLAVAAACICTVLLLFSIWSPELWSQYVQIFLSSGQYVQIFLSLAAHVQTQYWELHS